MNQVLVAFSAGTSGRFISTISYMLENNLNKEVKWTKDNSAHDVDIDQHIWLLTKELLFVGKKSWKIKFTHQYPDFDLIKNKIPNCKFIIIGFTKDNITEIMFNHILKNNKDDPLYNVQNMGIVPFEKIRTYDDDPYMKELIIPEQYKQDTLVIMYDEIYKEENNSFVVLEKISKFLNKPINEFILKSYKGYVDGRKRILQENKQYIDAHNRRLQENNTSKI
jgi:hypothetical protein